MLSENQMRQLPDLTTNQLLIELIKLVDSYGNAMNTKLNDMSKELTAIRENAQIK